MTAPDPDRTTSRVAWVGTHVHLGWSRDDQNLKDSNMLTKEQQEAVERLKRAVVGFPGRFSADVETLIALTEAPDSPDQPAAFTDALASAQADPAWVAKWRVPEAEAVEPVAWAIPTTIEEFKMGGLSLLGSICSSRDDDYSKPLYTHPPTIQADLDRAVEALRFYANAWDQDCDAQLIGLGVWDGGAGEIEPADALRADKGRLARETLATITKGQKP